MAGSMKEIKLRIRSVESTMQITKAMELVASSKLRRAKERVEGSRPYFETLYSTLYDIVSADSGFDSPYLARRDTNRRLYIVIAGDRGLAGGYNSNILKAIEADAQKPATLSTRVISAALDETETARIVEMYSDGDLARSRGWTNELLADHFVTVKAVYEAQYDGTKTFLDSGTITEFFYLTQYNDGRWRIVDNGVRSVQR